MMNNVLKLLDLAVYSVFLYLAYGFYYKYTATQDPAIALQYDYVYFAALLYTIIRRPDINTLTLSLAVVIFRVIDTVLLHDVENLGGFINYTVLMLLNGCLVIVIWTRPVLFSKIWLWKDNKNFAVTHQDNVLGSIFTVQAAFTLLLIVEHTSRRINTWLYENSRILYYNFETIQFLFTIAIIAILYYMTFDRAKEKRPDRKPLFNKQSIQL